MKPAARIGMLAWVALGLLAGAACTDLDRVLDVVFPPQVPGLPAGDSWVALPIGSWVTEGDVEASAMAACFSSACAAPVGIGVFHATGREARLLDELLADPARLTRWIEERDRRDANAKRRKLRTQVSSEPVSEGPYRGIAVRLSRRDGSHPAFGLLLARREANGTGVILAIGRDRDATERVVRSVEAAQI